MLRRYFVFATALCGAVSLVACSGEFPAGPSPVASTFGAGGTQAEQSASHSTASMRVFPVGPDLSGTSSLTRTGQGMSMTVHANDLIPGNAYTVWFAIFNSPDGCIGGCGVDDVLANRGVPSLRLGGGHVVGQSGRGNFGGQLAAGETDGPPCAMDANLGICGPGLLDARTAVIHLVLRAHGEAIPGLVDEQIGSFGGGCQVNACGNVQFAEHLP